MIGDDVRHCDHFDRTIIRMVNLAAFVMTRGLEDAAFELEIGNMSPILFQVAIVQFFANQ